MVELFWNSLKRSYPSFQVEVDELRSICQRIGVTEIPLLCRFQEEVISKENSFWKELRKRLKEEDGKARAIGYVVVLCKDNGIEMSRNVSVIETPNPGVKWPDLLNLLKKLFA